MPGPKKPLSRELSELNKKIVVLDDDPTGVQTVHGISVYTDWSELAFMQGFAETNSMFFILTNSRGFLSGNRLAAAHREIARNLAEASKKSGKDLLVISRSDSTLRGHYPFETEILKEELERRTGKHFDGEVICPFFKEGGRFTIDNVHYVKEREELIPAGMTEFAKDKSFGYRASHLGDWCEEKTGGAYKAAEMIYIELKELREANYSRIEEKLLSSHGF